MKRRRKSNGTQPVTSWVLPYMIQASWLKLCIAVAEDSSAWRRHPVVSPRSAVGKDLLKNLFLLLISAPLCMALVVRTAMACLLFPLSHPFTCLKAEMKQHWSEFNLLPILRPRPSYTSACFLQPLIKAIISLRLAMKSKYQWVVFTWVRNSWPAVLKSWANL